LDKPNKGQITIKLNGEKQNIVESKKIYPEMSNDPYMENQNDFPDIEQETFLETASAQETVDESFDWIIPDMTENEIEEYKIASSHSTSKKSTPLKKIPGRSYSSIIFPGIFAILIGTTFGFLMLKLVLTEHSNKAITEPVAVEQQGTKEEAANTTSAVIKSFTPYVVQEGMYTTKASASDAAKKAEGLGLPAKAINIGGKEFLFLGVADTQDTAKKIGGLFKEKGIEGFYAKPLAMDEKTVSNVNEIEKTFLETVPSVYQSLSKMTSDAIVTKKIAEDKTKEIDVLLSETGIKSDTVKQIRAELFAAEEKLKSYQKTKQTKDLTASQQHLLNFLSQYYALK
jgi:stage II sporulation protein B